MRRIISCQFNIDTACVDVEYEDGFVLSIYTPAVEDAVAHLQRPAGVCRTGYEREKRGISENGYAVIEWKEIRPCRVVDGDGFFSALTCEVRHIMLKC